MGKLGDLENSELHSKSKGFKSVNATPSKRSSSFKADMFALSISPILMIIAFLGFGLTNYRNIFVKLLGSLITLICLGLGIWWLVILGKSLLDDKKKPTHPIIHPNKTNDGGRNGASE